MIDHSSDQVCPDNPLVLAAALAIHRHASPKEIDDGLQLPDSKPNVALEP